MHVHGEYVQYMLKITSIQTIHYTHHTASYPDDNHAACTTATRDSVFLPFSSTIELRWAPECFMAHGYDGIHAIPVPEPSILTLS